MGQALAKPDFADTSHADALSTPARPKTPTRPSKNDEAQKHEKTETLYQSANFVTVDNNLSQLKSQNNFLFGEHRKMHHAYLLAARTFFPSPPTLDEVFFTFHNPIFTRTKMPATRHTRRTSATPYKPYGPYPLDIFMLQASILQNIQQITDFTYVDDVNMTPANLLVAIHLLVKCDLTLENIESALNIATPGSKYQYYRAVFLDYEDIILDQK
jgi:hypothetical protein